MGVEWGTKLISRCAAWSPSAFYHFTDVCEDNREYRYFHRYQPDMVKYAASSGDVWAQGRSKVRTVTLLLAQTLDHPLPQPQTLGGCPCAKTKQISLLSWMMPLRKPWHQLNISLSALIWIRSVKETMWSLWRVLRVVECWQRFSRHVPSWWWTTVHWQQENAKIPWLFKPR